MTSVVHILLNSWFYELKAIHDKFCTHCTKFMVVRTNVMHETCRTHCTKFMVGRINGFA